MFSQALIHPHDPRFIIQIHGGAWAIPEALSVAHIDGVTRAYQASLAALQVGHAPCGLLKLKVRGSISGSEPCP